MNEIVKMVAAKTGLSESIAKIAADTVLSQLKSKLPPAIGGQLDSLMGGSGSKSTNPLGGLTDKLGGLLGKK